MSETNLETIAIYGACENNLKNISLHIPKRQITVFTGVSGSGKSSLCMDTIAASSRRELNETLPSFAQRYLPKYGRPHVSRIENLPVAIVLDQKKPVPNSRSTVGTYTDTYALLRLLYSRIGRPFAGYSDTFSFNHPMGRCTRCDGLGEVTDLDVHKLVDFNKSLNEEGAINYIAFKPGGWRWIEYAHSGLFDLNKKIKDYTPEELDMFLYSPQIRLKNPPANWPKTAKYEGLITRMYRSVIRSQEGKRHKKRVEAMATTQVCPQCKGARLNEKVLACRINGKNIAEVTDMAIPEILQWLELIEDPLAVDIQTELSKRLAALQQIGLDYLALSRGMNTLSGGEAQRCKIAKYINSVLSDMLYILDEPSVGLHSHDIRLVRDSVQDLRRRGNTVLLVEHHKEMIKAADHIVDMGPGSGTEGGNILFEGTYAELLEADTLTGRMLKEKIPLRSGCRAPADWFAIENANYHNLRNLSVRLPLGVLTVIAGVAGSGKSSLMEYFCQVYPEEVIYINQRSIGASLRSTPATYLNVADEIRKVFVKETKAGSEMFSFNGKGACPVCSGKGVIISDMAFMDAIETPCEACGGLRYSQEALQYKLNGLNIAEVMDLTVKKAGQFFAGSQIAKKLHPLEQVELGYLRLNQALSTLSGGELQRVKLASYLSGKGEIFILDEPTDGLHPDDIQNMIALFHSMVERGNTIVLVEHNLDVLKAADYVVELGPGGGANGGQLLFAGTPEEMLSDSHSITAPFLKQELPDLPIRVYDEIKLSHISVKRKVKDWMCGDGYDQ